jgi:hypothetical protein
MKSSRYFSRKSFCWSPLILAIVIGVPAGTASAQGKKQPRPKSTAAVKTAAKSSSTPPGAATKYDQHLAANMKLLNVLSRYAVTLARATDTASANLAVARIETITKEAITAGEELVKLGRPEPAVETKLAKDTDLEMASRNVAEQTRTAVKALAANAAVKAILAPAVENFEAALNRIQQAADDPRGPGTPASPAAPAPATDTAGTPPAVPENPAPAADENSPAETRASEAASVPPPPPPPQ